MNTEYLKILKNHLVTLTNTSVSDRIREFNMNEFFRRKLFPHTCKSAVCALGEATFIPEFEKAGLYLEVMLIQGENFGDVIFKTFRGMKAAQTFFDLSLEEALYLFDPKKYDRLPVPITPLHVIEHLNDLLSGRHPKEQPRFLRGF